MEHGMTIMHIFSFQITLGSIAGATIAMTLVPDCLPSAISIVTVIPTGPAPSCLFPPNREVFLK